MSKIISINSFEELNKSLNDLETDSLIILVDQNVWQLYKNKIDVLNINNKKVILWKCPDGEKAKTFSEYESCLEFLLEKNVHRKSHLVAIGGGATSDFAGFVSATLLRGIKWSVIPTTFLSMIDASIGGKVAINSKSGKNLIGAFHEPESVWMLEEFLSSLDSLEFASGKCELLKYAFLDKEIFDLVQNDLDYSLIAQKCSEYKKKICIDDLKESGKRKLLNLGHSFGHAYESIYKIPHGEAVLWGLLTIIVLFNEDHLFDMRGLVKRLELNYSETPWLNRTYPLDKVMQFLKKDKKVAENNAIDLVLINKVGECFIEKSSLDSLEGKIKQKENELRKIVL